jgi:hypothetical protein
MNANKIFLLKWSLAFSVGVMVACCSLAQEMVNTNGPAKVELRQVDGRWLLYVNQRPFYIKGAGLEYGSQEKLAAHGANSFRTWTTDNGRDTGRQVLDRALSNGLMVAMGLDVDHERRGFDYSDTNMVARQFALLRSQILEYRNHPALLVWVVGNELNFEKNPKVWDAVNDLSKMIHELDPNHPTTTTLAGFKHETADLVKTRAPDLDFISFQMYSDIINLPKYLREAAWDKPTSSPNGARAGIGSAVRPSGARRLKTTARRRRTFMKNVSMPSSSRIKNFVSAPTFFSGATNRNARRPGMACS